MTGMVGTRMGGRFIQYFANKYAKTLLNTIYKL
jgi:hypothetical protein